MKINDDFVQYPNDPSLAPAVIFTVLFGLFSLVHTFHIIRTRSWFFLPFVAGGLNECIGYAGRTINATETSGEWSKIPFFMQSMFLLMSPSMLSAAIYLVLGRIITLTGGERHSVIPLRWLTKIFVCGEIISLNLIVGGVSLMAFGGESLVKWGPRIIMAGLGHQIAFLVVFMLTAATFHYRMLKSPTKRLSETHYIPWREHLLVLYVGSNLILARSCFRIFEYALGRDGFLMRHEWCLYVMDGVPIILVMAVYVWRHPSEIDALLKGHGANSTRHGFSLRTMV